MDSTPIILNLPQTLAEGFWFPTDGSAKNLVDAPAIFILWICGIFLVFNASLMVYFAWRYRQKKKDTAATGSTHNTALEVTWSIIPAFILAIMFLWGFRNYLVMATPPDGAYDIMVTGYKWGWDFTYPDGINAKPESATDPETGESKAQPPALHAPAGVAVRLTLQSQDVLHSVFIPELRVKKDVVPGRYNQMWFKADFNDDPEKVEVVDLPTLDGGTVSVRRNTYNLFCTEYCGQNHSMMITKVYIYSPEDFDKWYEAKALIDPGTPLTKVGETIWATQCKACHSINGSSGTGPTWKDLYAQAGRGTSVGPVDVDDAYIYESIRNPAAKIANGFGNQMAAFPALTDREIRGLIEYMKSISVHAEPEFNPDLTYGDLNTDGTDKAAGEGGEEGGAEEAPADAEQDQAAQAATH